jgi:hypothetical protein
MAKIPIEFAWTEEYEDTPSIEVVEDSEYLVFVVRGSGDGTIEVMIKPTDVGRFLEDVMRDHKWFRKDFADFLKEN